MWLGVESHIFLLNLHRCRFHMVNLSRISEIAFAVEIWEDLRYQFRQFTSSKCPLVRSWKLWLAALNIRHMPIVVVSVLFSSIKIVRRLQLFQVISWKRPQLSVRPNASFWCQCRCCKRLLVMEPRWRSWVWSCQIFLATCHPLNHGCQMSW